MLINYKRLDEHRVLYMKNVKGRYGIGIYNQLTDEETMLKVNILNIEEAIEKFEYFYEKLK